MSVILRFLPGSGFVARPIQTFIKDPHPLKNGIGGGGWTPAVPFMVAISPFVEKTSNMELGDPTSPAGLPLSASGQGSLLQILQTPTKAITICQARTEGGVCPSQSVSRQPKGTLVLRSIP